MGGMSVIGGDHIRTYKDYNPVLLLSSQNETDDISFKRLVLKPTALKHSKLSTSNSGLVIDTKKGDITRCLQEQVVEKSSEERKVPFCTIKRPLNG